MSIRTKRNPFILLGLIWFVILANPLYAYLDPGTGSMFLQLLMGGIAGLLVFVKIYWRKFTNSGFLRSKNSDNNPGDIVRASNSNPEEL